MLELLKSLVFAVIMVPVVMKLLILGLIYGLGEVFNIFSDPRSERRRAEPLISQTPAQSGVFDTQIWLSCRYFCVLSLMGMNNRWETPEIIVILSFT